MRTNGSAASEQYYKNNTLRGKSTEILRFRRKRRGCPERIGRRLRAAEPRPARWCAIVKLLVAGLALNLAALAGTPAVAADARELVTSAFNYIRDKASVALVEMTVHRPDWQRTVTIRAWTLGEKDSLFTIVAPARDKGNGTLKKGREMWMFNPKINRVIKLPPSMMTQSWMGSDFSNNDLAKSDTLVHEYTHTITGTETHEGKTVFVVESIPKPQAPVVWGKQRLKIREDHLFLEQTFFDEDLKPVKNLKFLEIKTVDGKPYPQKWIMQPLDQKDKHTVVEYKMLKFMQNLPAELFTVSNLRNPKR